MMYRHARCTLTIPLRRLAMIGIPGACGLHGYVVPVRFAENTRMVVVRSDAYYFPVIAVARVGLLIVIYVITVVR
jgi:hypothetical protein